MKKVMNIIGKVLTVVILLFAIFVMVFTVISVNTLGKDADFLGYKPYIVLSDSMKDTFEIGDLTVSKAVDPSTLDAGDIVTFKSIDPNNYGQIITHKIREITEYEGQPAFITYGTTTGTDDSYPVPFENVVGEYQFRLPKMGYFFKFLRTPAGYFSVILLPFVLLIILQAVKFFGLLRRYKAEQRAELEEQKAQLKAERLETMKMKEELEQLRAQIGISIAQQESDEKSDSSSEVETK